MLATVEMTLHLILHHDKALSTKVNYWGGGGVDGKLLKTSLTGDLLVESFEMGAMRIKFQCVRSLNEPLRNTVVLEAVKQRWKGIVRCKLNHNNCGR